MILSGYKIDTQKFATYTTETAQKYVRLYGWYPMSLITHKILIHGPQIIESAILPIVQLLEEAVEARNEYFRLYRQ